MYTPSIILTLLPLITASPISLPRATSGKRGLAFNEGALTKLFGSSEGKVSWMYNWNSETSEAAEDLEYVPMLHSNKNVHTDSWDANIKKAIDAGAQHVMSFNEPDQCGGGGACMQDVPTTIRAHKQYLQPLASSHPHLQIGAPAVTNGVQDPATGAKMGLPFLKAFLEGCDGCKIDFVCAHWYDSADKIDYFKQHLQEVRDAAGGDKKVWITEFGVRGGGDEEGFMREAVEWLDGQEWVERYAWQWAAPGELVNAEGNGLSALGEVYATTG